MRDAAHTEHSREPWAGQPRQSIEAFSALGYEIFQTDLWLKYSLRPDGTFDMEDIRKQLAGILDVNGSRVSYFGLPLRASLPFFKALLGEARVRTYVDNTAERDDAAVGRGRIGIYSVTGCERTVQPLNGNNRTVARPPFSTRYFDIRDGGDK